jgi:hypothetical protein
MHAAREYWTNVGRMAAFAVGSVVLARPVLIIATIAFGTDRYELVILRLVEGSS